MKSSKKQKILYRLFGYSIFLSFDLLFYIIFGNRLGYQYLITNYLIKTIGIDQNLYHLLQFIEFSLFFCILIFLMVLYERTHISYSLIEAFLFGIYNCLKKVEKILLKIEKGFYYVSELVIGLGFLVSLIALIISGNLVAGFILFIICLLILSGPSQFIPWFLSLDIILKCYIAYLRITNDLGRSFENNYIFKLTKVKDPKKYETNDFNFSILKDQWNWSSIKARFKTLNPKNRESTSQSDQSFEDVVLAYENLVIYALIITFAICTVIYSIFDLDIITAITVFFLGYFIIGLPLVIAEYLFKELDLVDKKSKINELDDLIDDISIFTGGYNPKLGRLFLNFIILIFSLPMLIKSISLVLIFPLIAIFSHLLIGFFLSFSNLVLDEMDEIIEEKIDIIKLKLVERPEFEWKED